MTEIDSHLAASLARRFNLARRLASMRIGATVCKQQASSRVHPRRATRTGGVFQ